ncbi:hypothetical protein [Campylobacter sp. RM12651]|uniref:hypothetical protein n=1 Tax=Campylobacter sp. RM12651 TaxID=1660079 RepID=UPI001EFB5E90|nr:hypothetical protein [Campylobacter sp. RM12651]ULO04528.1 hypothetical protein AVBRAN_a0046 [Campylobacter sp. RM12651]
MNLNLDMFKIEQNAFFIDFIFYIINNNLDNTNCINIKLKDVLNLSKQSNIVVSLNELEMLLNIKYIFNKNKDFICASLFSSIKINKDVKNIEEQEILFFINIDNFRLVKEYFKCEYGQISERELKFYFALKSGFAKKIFKLILKQKKINTNSFRVKIDELLAYLSLDNYANNNAYRVVRNAIKTLLDTTYIDAKKDRLYFEAIVLNRCKEKDEKFFEINFTIADKDNEAVYKISSDDEKYINKILNLYKNPDFYTYSENNETYYRLYNYDKKQFFGKKYIIYQSRLHIFDDGNFNISSKKSLKYIYEKILSQSFIRITPKEDPKKPLQTYHVLQKIDVNKYI